MKYNISNNYVNKVNSIAIDVCLNNGENKIFKLKLKDGIALPDTTNLYFDYYNQIVKLEISYSEFEFLIIDNSELI